jgi:putative ABC transport system substrate-binding protein
MRRREFMSFMGGAAALPFATSAAMGKVPTVGYLSDEGAGPHPFRSHRPVLDALRELGYVEGKNILVEYRNANGEVGKLPSFAAELAALPVDVIFAVGTPAARAAVAATKTVPIVFSRIGDPVAAGLVASLARPNGNATGVTVITADLAGRRLQVLKEFVPELTALAILHEPKFLAGQLELKALTPVAQSINLQLRLVGIETFEALENAAAPLVKESAQALFVGSSGLFSDHYQLAIDAASKAHLPALYVRREYPAAGGLVSYGIPYRDMYRTAAGYVDRVLKGTNPSDLPVQNPVKTELVINLKAAKALGLTVPDKLLAITDEVIES